MDALLFKVAYVFYTASTALYIAYLITKKPSLSRLAFRLLMVAVSVHAGSLLTRTIMARSLYVHQAAALRLAGDAAGAAAADQASRWYVPWSDWFESFSFFGAVIAVLYLAIAAQSPIPILGSFIMLISWGLLTGSLFHDSRLQPFKPAIDNAWVAVHVPVMFTSYSILSIASTVALAYLIEERQMKAKRPTDISFQLPSLDQLDQMLSRLVLAAVPLLTIGIVIGGIWANTAWGRFWAWDSKETWALITWAIYVTYLGLRFLRGWRGRKSAYVSLLGFASIIFTFLGANSALHGFLSGKGH